MAERRMHRLRVLIVDDNNHMVKIVKTILRGFGVKELFDARDPSEANDLLRSSGVDLIITDFAMEPVNGCQFVRQLRASEDPTQKFVPVIMLSAYSEKTRVEAARDAGITEFCSKPVTAIELYNKLNAIINSPRSFVRTEVYFGPDRRRHSAANFSGDERRDADRDETVETPVSQEKMPA